MYLALSFHLNNHHYLSFSKAFLSSSLPTPLFQTGATTGTVTIPRKTAVIRMGGGPRTYPGGVSKWQWKRMQAKKAKQLLKARLCRERQIYEMRKRAELKAAVSELERPWEPVERNNGALFSVSADEQVKVLADRFQRPGGFDLWSEKDGPQLFQTPDRLPSARFFPKGVVHSVKPYGKIDANGGESEIGSENGSGGDVGREGYKKRGNSSVSVNGKLRGNGRYERKKEGMDLPGMERSSDLENGSENESGGDVGRRGYKGKNTGWVNRNLRRNGKYEVKSEDVELPGMEGGSDLESGYTRNSVRKSGMGKGVARRNGDDFRKKGSSRGRFGGGLGALGSGQAGFDRKERGASMSKRGGGNRFSMSRSDNRTGRREGLRNLRNSESEVYDMSLQQDGSYGFRTKKNEQVDSDSWARGPLDEFDSISF